MNLPIRWYKKNYKVSWKEAYLIKLEEEAVERDVGALLKEWSYEGIDC